MEVNVMIYGSQKNVKLNFHFCHGVRLKCAEIVFIWVKNNILS